MLHTVMKNQDILHVHTHNDRFTPEKLAAEVLRQTGLSDKYRVLQLLYSGTCYEYSHRTLKAALRRLGSTVDSARGKQHRRGAYINVILTPKGELLSWTDARNLIEEGAL